MPRSIFGVMGMFNMIMERVSQVCTYVKNLLNYTLKYVLSVILEDAVIKLKNYNQTPCTYEIGPY